MTLMVNIEMVTKFVTTPGRYNMPVTIKKKPSGKYSVSTPGGTKAKNTTEKKAKAQKRLLDAIEHNPDFKPRKKKD